MEKTIAKTSGKYCFGDNLTLADIFFHPQITAAVEKIGIDIQKYPKLKEISENLSKIPEFIDALPKNQPDFK